MKKDEIFETLPVRHHRERTRVVSPRQFLNLSYLEKRQIECSRIVAPKLGEKATFGKIKIKYK